MFLGREAERLIEIIWAGLGRSPENQGRDSFHFCPIRGRGRFHKRSSWRSFYAEVLRVKLKTAAMESFSTHDGDAGSFGLKVQIQGVSGRPFVVLNSQGRRVRCPPDYPDVFLDRQQRQELVSSMSGSASSAQTPRLDHSRSLRTFRNPQLNYQKNPEILRPYDPCGRGSFSGPSSPASASPVMVKRARIPLPGAGYTAPTVESLPFQSSHIICRLSDPQSGGEVETNRSGHIRAEDKRRSRSLESRSGGTETSSSSDVKAEVRSASVRSEVKKEEQSNPAREAQVTPDLLKGQRELPDHPDEETAKLVMVSYLRDGSSDCEAVVRRRVELMFEQMHMMKFRALEECEDPLEELKDLQDRRAALESHVSHLRQQLEEEVKNRESLSEEKEERNAELRRLQEELQRSEQEQQMLRHTLTDMEKELQTSLDQLLQARRARDQCRCDMKDLQQQLSDIHDELDSAKSCESGQTDALLQDLCVLRCEFEALQQVQEEQEQALHRRERELTALKGALEEEISAHARDVEAVQEEHQQEIHRLLRATEEAKESVALLGRKVLEVAVEKESSQMLISELRQTKAELEQESCSLEEQISSLNDAVQQKSTQEQQLRERVQQLTMEKRSLEEELQEVRQQEEDMCGANRALMRHLEDTQSELSRLNRAHRELKERFDEESRQMQELQRRRSELEEERRNQEHVFERLQEEMSAAVVSSEQETQRLQEEVDELRDQSQRERDVLHSQLHNTHTQLHTHTHAAQEYQRERCVLEEQLSRCEADLSEAELKTQQLQKKINQLEEEQQTHDDRHSKLMEVRVCELERSVMEERSGSDGLMKRLERGREQMEQVRCELLQERAARHELECDRIRQERQNKDLRRRVSELEDSRRTGHDATVSKLQLHVQELEDRLMGEEKENGDLQQANRKLERRMKEMMLHLEEEQLALQDQRDQLALRLKSLKCQLDEAEEEIERLENHKKKQQRDLEEQQELNEQMSSEISSLRTQLRRCRRADKAQSSADEDEEEQTDAPLLP